MAVLSALPPEMQQEILEQERRRQESQRREQPADVRNAEEMDNASFIASLTTDLREEILTTADEAFLV